MVVDFDDPVRESIGLGRNFLTQYPALEGVIAASDYLALGLIAAAQERGLRVPTDLKITGVDDFVLGLQASVPLTTYHIPYEEVGRRCFAFLQERVQQPDAPTRLETVRGEIVVRASA